MSRRSPSRLNPIDVLRRRPAVLAGLVVVLVALLVGATALEVPRTIGAGRTDATIFGPEASSLDPAVQSDAGSAQVVSQLFESLTAEDTALHVQPALAESWQTLDAGRQVVFHLRPNLTFSNGSPLRAADVVASWLRLLSPSHPSQLASLLDDVVGAADYRDGKGPKSGVGLTAPDDRTVRVQLASPAADFPAIASSPSLAVVPSDIDSNPSDLQPGSFVGSGGYVVSAQTKTEITLKANTHYWAGTPAIRTIHLESSIGGKSTVDEFRNGNLDYTPISVYDASWISYDRTLGPLLRSEPSAAVQYYGFDTSKAPFSDVRVRRAFAEAVDWQHLVDLLGPPYVYAASMVPPGIPGRGDTRFGPKFDLQAARADLAAAGFADGKGFPKVTFVTTGGALDDAVVAEIKKNLGIELDYETLDFDTYNTRLLTDPPAIWELGWVADYPGANDFLGLLLGSGKANNYGRWNSPEFDAAIGKALSATDQTAMVAAFDQAQTIVQRDVPVIPTSYSTDYSLAAKGLLGAAPNGQGLVRYAGLAWGSGS